MVLIWSDLVAVEANPFFFRWAAVTLLSVLPAVTSELVTVAAGAGAGAGAVF